MNPLLGTGGDVLDILLVLPLHQMQRSAREEIVMDEIGLGTGCNTQRPG